jgi:hypothetical protein
LAVSGVRCAPPPNQAETANASNSGLAAPSSTPKAVGAQSTNTRYTYFDQAKVTRSKPCLVGGDAVSRA